MYSRKFEEFKLHLVSDCKYAGRCDMPTLEATHFKPTDIIPFNRAISENNPSDKWLHFFIDDYQFERIWNAPNKYISVLKKFAGVITTDFSMYTDMPRHCKFTIVGAIVLWHIGCRITE